MKTFNEYIDSNDVKFLSLSKYLIEADEETGDEGGNEGDGEGEDNGDKPALGTEEATKEKEEKEKNPLERGEIQFTIWETPNKKVKWLKDNNSYQKIEYKCEFKKEHLEIDFLLGFQENEWKLWIGKIGSCSYDDDPFCSFETNKFGEAVVKCLDKVEEFITSVKEDPTNYVQFYKNL